MTDPKFIHLRVHTAYSLSEGAIKIDACFKRAGSFGYCAQNKNKKASPKK